jgi:hypothetical protein
LCFFLVKIINQLLNEEKRNVLNKSDSFYESTASNEVDCF